MSREPTRFRVMMEVDGDRIQFTAVVHYNPVWQTVALETNKQHFIQRVILDHEAAEIRRQADEVISRVYPCWTEKRILLVTREPGAEVVGGTNAPVEVVDEEDEDEEDDEGEDAYLIACEVPQHRKPRAEKYIFVLGSGTRMNAIGEARKFLERINSSYQVVHKRVRASDGNPKHENVIHVLDYSAASLSADDVDDTSSCFTVELRDDAARSQFVLVKGTRSDTIAVREVRNWLKLMKSKLVTHDSRYGMWANPQEPFLKVLTYTPPEPVYAMASK